METRIANSKDYEKLKRIWHTAFKDSTQYIDNLYKMLNATGYVLASGEDVKSCLTIFDVGTYHDKTVCEIYAVCTESSSQKLGYASTLVEYARNEIVGSGKIALTCPANKDLVSFYEKLGFEKHFYVSHDSVDAERQIAKIIEKNGISQYNNYREKILSKIPHIKLNANFIDFIIIMKEIESQTPILNGDVIVQGMINNDAGIKKYENEYPYFGFPIK